MSLSLLTGHRRITPYAMNGGEPGKTGENILEKSDGQQIKLGSTDSVKVTAGDAIIIKTPGGGGFGSR